MEVFIQVFIALSLYEFLYWFIYTLIFNISKKTKIDQEAQDYLEQQIKSKNDSEESLKNKKD
jgi:hypothetical protein